MADLVRVQVPTPRVEVEWFDEHCPDKGYKKSPLISQLVREHRDKEAFNPQPNLFNRKKRESKQL